MKTNDEIITFIKEKLDASPLSMSELASKVGISKSTLSRYLSKDRPFPLNKADNFAKILNVSTEEFLGLNNATISRDNNGIAGMSGDINGDINFSNEQSAESACRETEITDNSTQNLGIQKELLTHIDKQTEILKDISNKLDMLLLK